MKYVAVIMKCSTSKLVAMSFRRHRMQGVSRLIHSSSSPSVLNTHGVTHPLTIVAGKPAISIVHLLIRSTIS